MNASLAAFGCSFEITMFTRFLKWVGHRAETGSSLRQRQVGSRCSSLPISGCIISRMSLATI